MIERGIVRIKVKKFHIFAVAAPAFGEVMADQLILAVGITREEWNNSLDVEVTVRVIALISNHEMEALLVVLPEGIPCSGKPLIIVSALQGVGSVRTEQLMSEEHGWTPMNATLTGHLEFQPFKSRKS